MEQIKVNELSTEVTPSEAADVKGGLRISFREIYVSSYQIGGSG